LAADKQATHAANRNKLRACCARLSVVQHYVAEVAEPTYCGMNSISDVITANAGTQVNVVRELSAENIDHGRDPLRE
jgi:hypothetical protein